MEALGGGIQGDGAIGTDNRIKPALVMAIVHRKHMICKNFTKSQGGFIRRAGFFRGYFLKIYFHTMSPFSFRFKIKGASKNPKLRVTLLWQNDHLLPVNDPFASAASLDF
jgi:hypothetical protein